MMPSPGLLQFMDTEKITQAPWLQTSDEMHVPDIPDCSLGPWSIGRVSVDSHSALMANMRCIRDGHPEMAVRPGEYLRLVRDRTVVMSSTPMELASNLPAVENARGHCLINGLGLGIVAQSCALLERVDSVLVVEIDKTVIDLVGPHLDGGIEIVHADAMEFKPPRGRRYGMVWHDIWDDVTADNLPTMATLKRRYARRCDWQGAWHQELCRRLARE